MKRCKWCRVKLYRGRTIGEWLRLSKPMHHAKIDG